MVGSHLRRAGLQLAMPKLPSFLGPPSDIYIELLEAAMEVGPVGVWRSRGELRWAAGIDVLGRQLVLPPPVAPREQGCCMLLYGMPGTPLRAAGPKIIKATDREAHGRKYAMAHSPCGTSACMPMISTGDIAMA